MYWIALLLLMLPSCAWVRDWNHAELYKQQAGLVEDYRHCLAYNADNPEKQKNCAVYNQIRAQIDLTPKP